MKKFWEFLDNRSWSVRRKYVAAVLVFSILSALAGFAVWMVVRNPAFSSTDWMLCFIGYPVVISWLVIVWFLCNYDFCDGAAHSHRNIRENRSEKTIPKRAENCG